MKRFFHIRNRFFRLDLEGWKEARRKGRYIRYYLKPVKDGRNNLAREIDFYGPLIVLMMATLAIITAYTGVGPRSFIMATGVMAAEAFAAFRIRNLFRQQTEMHEKIWKAGRVCQERIKNEAGRGGLEKLAEEILGRVNGFDDVHITGDRGEKDGSPAERIISIRALYGGIPVAVGCIGLSETERAVPAEKVIRFKDEISRLDLRAGILVAPGLFSSDAKRAAREGGRKVALVDLYRLVDLARETGHKIFPEGKNEAGGANTDRATAYRRLARTALTRDRAPAYLMSAAIMLSMQHLSAVGDPLRPGYTAFGLANLALSAYCLISNREGDFLGRIIKR